MPTTQPPADIVDKAREIINRYGMLSRNDKVVIAVSGGADSVCLLYILYSLRDELGISIHIAHLNHMLRGKESDKDMEFVKELAGRLSMPISTDCVDILSYSKEKQSSIEECARDIRYDFLVKVAKMSNANKIAVGHTKDDQAETVLMRLLRGSGARGLCGIPAVRSIQGITLIRPLLGIWRKEIEAYLKENKIPYRCDSSNQTEAYFRNRLRLELLPILEKGYNPNIKEVLVNMAENLFNDYEYINEAAKNKFAPCVDTGIPDRVSIDIKKFSNYHIAIQKQLIRLAIARLKGSLRRIEFRHWQELEELIFKRPDNSIVDLTNDIAAQKKKNLLIIYSKNHPKIT